MRNFEQFFLGINCVLMIYCVLIINAFKLLLKGHMLQIYSDNQVELRSNFSSNFKEGFLALDFVGIKAEIKPVFLSYCSELELGSIECFFLHHNFVF